MTQQLTHHANLGARIGLIDRVRGVIPGVSVITSGRPIGKGFGIDSDSLDTVVAAGNSQPNGVKVKLEHTDDVKDIIAVVRNFRRDGDQVRGDLHLFMSHPRALSVLDIAQNAPDACGLSIAFEFTRASRDGEDFIRVTKLFSVDLVDSPAANPGGLFSAHTPIIQPMPADELEAVARATYGNAQVDSWKRNTLGLRELATRNFHLDGLNVVGLDTRAVAAKYGQPEISGLARVRRGELQARVNRFFAAKSAAK